MIVRATWYFNNLVLALLRLVILAATDILDEVIKEVMFWFAQLITLVADAAKEVADLFFRMIFDLGGFGSTMKDILNAMCAMFNFVLEIWNVTGCEILRTIIAPIIGFLLDILGAIISFFASGSGGILGFLRDLNTYIANSECSYKVDCIPSHSTSFRDPGGANPVASRCWADYVSGLDESDTFACTRSDTCVTSALDPSITQNEFGGFAVADRQTLCYSCPIQMGGYVNPFGCDTSTQQCTCNVPKRERTYCTANEQCMIQVFLSRSIFFSVFKKRHSGINDVFFSRGSHSSFFFSKNEKRDGSVQFISVPGIRRGVSIKPNLRNSETDHTDH
jgi:hypothetical protein